MNNVHALNFIHEPRSYIINDRPSFTRHYFADLYLKSSKNTHKETTISTDSSPVSCSTKFTVKLMT